MSKFVKGDYVKLIKPHARHDGKFGVVTDTKKARSNVLFEDWESNVLFEDGEEMWFNDKFLYKSFKKNEEEPKKMSKFIKGDFVELRKPYAMHDGEIGVVTDTAETGSKVSFRDGEEIWFNNMYLDKRYTADKKQKPYSIDDIVRIIKTGEYGRVVGVSYNAYRVRVMKNIDDYTEKWYSADELEYSYHYNFVKNTEVDPDNGRIRDVMGEAECKSENNSVNHPEHYKAWKYECIDIMKDQFGKETVENFCLLNAFKYLYRCQKKDNFKQDLEKARWYIDYILKEEAQKL